MSLKTVKVFVLIITNGIFNKEKSVYKLIWQNHIGAEKL
jgi:hypothetical protein